MHHSGDGLVIQVFRRRAEHDPSKDRLVMQVLQRRAEDDKLPGRFLDAPLVISPAAAMGTVMCPP